MRIEATSPVRKTGRDNNIPPLLKLGIEDPYYFEQIKSLRAKLETLISLKNLKVLTVTSSIAGEGKTLSCANLAANLASAGRMKVLLVDADLRKADMARGMDVHPLPGLSEFIAGTVEGNAILRDSVIPGLKLIPAGTRIADPGDLLAGEKFRSFLGQAREQFDIVLLDSPPILPVADTMTLRDLVDGFLFLFRAGYTPHHMFAQAVEEVGAQSIVGVILNGVESKGKRYYQRYYGNYYRSTHIKESAE